MALVHNGFSTHRRAAFQPVAQLLAALTGAVKRLSESGWLTSFNDLRSLQGDSGPPGSVFDTRYAGLTAHAARLDVAICRRMRLRY